ncbi:unknown [Prevotella sp. CAG:617]|nr:unknown [Prevotella sp. CAG:617]
MPYIETANMIIADNLEAMIQNLHTSAYEILKLADEGVGITPWYYRQRLYKNLFGLSIETKRQ